MPYRIIHLNDGYRVQNELTGTIYSKKPQTLEKAQKQLKILESKPSAYRSMILSNLNLSNPVNKKNEGALKRWKNEKWVNLNAIKDKGIYNMPCGKKYKRQTDPTVCRPSIKINDKTPKPLAKNLKNKDIEKAIQIKKQGKRINWAQIVGGNTDNIVYLSVSPNPKYKYRAKVNNKNIDFGANGYSDYILSGGDDVKKNAYIARHQVREDWNNLNRGSFSRFILWNKKTLKASIKDMEKRFNIKIILV